MVNNASAAARIPSVLSVLVGGYVVVVAGALIALAAMSATGASGATVEAWVHAVIVAVVAVLLPLRLRSARRGSASAARAVAIISAVLVVVNVVEAALPGLFPVWMRIEMVGIAVLMAGVLVATIGWVRSGRFRGTAGRPMMEA